MSDAPTSTSTITTTPTTVVPAGAVLGTWEVRLGSGWGSLGRIARVVVLKVGLAAALIGVGFLAGGGKLHMPSLHWPTPAPSKPDWAPPDNPPPLPPFTPLNTPSADEWRPLPWARGWEGYGHDVDGVFMIKTWRPIRATAMLPPAATPPQSMPPVPLAWLGPFPTEARR